MVDVGSGKSGNDPKRGGARQRVLLTGLVASTDLSTSFRCTIRERSEAGARIKVANTQIVPPRFWLIDVSTALAHDASVAWRREPEVGVSLNPPAIDLRKPSDDSLHRRLRALWLEVAPRASE
jgi:hypothetical protein